MIPPDSGPERDTNDEPVAGYGKFTWRTGRWEKIFDRQVEVIQAELARAHAEDRVVVYLSCPISSRGGGSSRTNVDIANFSARRLMERWGERVSVLNPAVYQMESREGTGLILERVRELWPKEDPEAYLKLLTEDYRPGGGDYMRMWIRVLVEDDRYPDRAAGGKSKRNRNCGGMFDGFYFLGPSDVHAFFADERRSSLTQVVESYFARKYATDLDFRREFDAQPSDASRANADQIWEDRRKRFFRYYAVRASASYSLGSRDEWNTLVRLNTERRGSDAYGPGEELACYFDGRQVTPAAASRMVTPGYEVSPGTGPPQPAREIAWPEGFVAPPAE